jgi:hypothetical protein
MHTPLYCDEPPTLRLEIKTLRMDSACFEGVAGDSDDNRMQGFKSSAANGELEFAKNLTYSATATMHAFMERDMREQVAWLAQRARTRGYANLDDLLSKAPTVYTQLSGTWWQAHPCPKRDGSKRRLRRMSMLPKLAFAKPRLPCPPVLSPGRFYPGWPVPHMRVSGHRRVTCGLN